MASTHSAATIRVVCRSHPVATAPFTVDQVTQALEGIGKEAEPSGRIFNPFDHLTASVSPRPPGARPEERNNDEHEGLDLHPDWNKTAPTT